MISSDLIIVGGGAAGLFAAAVCAEAAPGRRILVLEKGPCPLAKVRVSGGGRCNLTHQCSDIRAFVKNYPRGGSELIGPFHRFGPAETMHWFEAHGVPLITLDDGCVFPRSDTSEDVIRALLQTAGHGNVEIKTNAAVSSVRLPQTASSEENARGFELELTNGSRAVCKTLLVATGGGSFLDGLGHTIEPCVPSLFTFNTSNMNFTELAGIVVEDVRISAPGLKAEGALLITHNGVSGPAVLRLSSFGARTLAEKEYRFEMKINWLPSQSEAQIFQTLESFRADSPRKQLGTWSPVGLSSRLWKLLLACAGADETREWGTCPIKTLRHIATQVSGFMLPITGRVRHRAEFVTCGGIRLKEVDFQNMQSRLCPGLYFAGEVLDIDALTGGFNLQSAWTTAYLASMSCIARRP